MSHTARPFSNLRSLVALASLACTAAGCSSGGDTTAPDAMVPDTGVNREAGGSGDDGSAADANPEAGPMPSGPPEIRAVNVDLQGSLPVSFDLGSSEATWVLPDPAAAQFSILAHDDVDTGADLHVTVRDSVTGKDVKPTSQTFERGLWQIEVEVHAGSELRVVVTDSSGNETAAAHGLTLPSQAEAVIGTWQQRSYDAMQTVTGRRDLQFDAKGKYTDTGPGADQARGGTYSIANGALTLEQRTQNGVDNNPDTIEQTDTATLYVDTTYLSPNPYTRVDGSNNYEGHWMRSRTDTASGMTTQVTETLELAADGTFSLTLDEGGTTTTVTGTYVVNPASSYTQTYGEFLVRTRTSMNGSPITPIETTELFTLRAGRLLVSPYVAQ